MKSKDKEKCSFVQQMHSQLLQYQLQKLKRLELKHSTNGQYFQTQLQAKETLIDLDNEKEESKLMDDDIFIGRWSNYKIPEKIQSRFNFNTKIKNSNKLLEDCRVATESAKSKFTHNSKSQKIIPQLKCILQQLKAPLHLPAGYQGLTPNKSIKKMKNYIGTKVLMVSNKQEIKHYATTQRKVLMANQSSHESENKRPRFTSKKKEGTIVESQKTKKVPNTHSKERNINCQKQVLSQLLKASYKPPFESSPLKNMITYFTISGSDNRRNKSNLLGFNRIIS